MLPVFLYYYKLLLKVNKIKLRKSKFKDRRYIVVPVNYDEKKYSKCPICLDSIYYSFTIYKTDCNHVFHRSCIEKWIKVKNFCPCCRKSNIKLCYEIIN